MRGKWSLLIMMSLALFVSAGGVRGLETEKFGNYRKLVPGECVLTGRVSIFPSEGAWRVLIEVKVLATKEKVKLYWSASRLEEAQALISLLQGKWDSIEYIEGLVSGLSFPRYIRVERSGSVSAFEQQYGLTICTLRRIEFKFRQQRRRVPRKQSIKGAGRK